MQPRKISRVRPIQIALFLVSMSLGKPGFTASPVPLASTPADPGAERDLRGALSISLLAGALTSAALPAEVFKTPPACRWCNGADPNAIDRWAAGAKWEDPCRAARLSYTTLGAAAVVAFGPLSHESNARHWAENTVAVTDSVAVAVMATQIVKYAVRRERPAPDTCHPGRKRETDRNLSFFSGHTSVAFALVASAHETARLRGRRSNDAVLWTGGAAAALTGYLRIAGDRHHLADVLTGAGVGYAIGRWIPRHVLRPDRKTSTDRPGMLRSPPGTTPAMFAYSRATSDGKVLVQLGKGPGRSLQVGIRF
jgi:membrane-associated phospholipid phosphatase